MALRIAYFGQAPFGRDVLERILADGHEIAAVYTPPETGRPDPVAQTARARGLPLFQHRYFRRRVDAGFEPIGRILDEYRGLDVELNVLAFVTAILPPEIVDHPPRRSLCFHPSLLPRFRGGNALAWQIAMGEKESGVSVFQPDAGVDTGPLVVQKGGVTIEATDTAGSLYFEKLYPLGVEALAEAVNYVAAGTAKLEAQDEAQASFQGLMGDAEARIDWAQPVERIDLLVRGCDPQPGAWAEAGGETVRFFAGRRVAGEADAPPGTLVGFEAGEARIAAAGGQLAVGRFRSGKGAKVAAAEAGLAAGTRFS